MLRKKATVATSIDADAVDDSIARPAAKRGLGNSEEICRFMQGQEVAGGMR